MAKFFKRKPQAPPAKGGAVSGSEAIDDYLKSIFQLSGREERQVSSTEIADDLDITAASVTNMLRLNHPWWSTRSTMASSSQKPEESALSKSFATIAC
jgi:hypothetical protein